MLGTKSRSRLSPEILPTLGLSYSFSRRLGMQLLYSLVTAFVLATGININNRAIMLRTIDIKLTDSSNQRG